MENVDEHIKRVDTLVKKTFSRLDSKTVDALKKCLVKIEPIYDKYFGGHNRFAKVIALDKDGTKWIMQLNIFRMKILSDDAIIGTIVHEVGHCLDLYRLTPSKAFRRMLYDIGFRNFEWKWSERKADEIAISLGFKNEIETLRKEAVTYNDYVTLSSKKQSNAIDWSKHEEFRLSCKNCSARYNGNYFYNLLTNRYSMTILNEDVIIKVVDVTNGNDTSEDEVIIITPCPSCGKKELVRFS